MKKKTIKAVVSGGTPTQAIREANYAPSVIRKPKVVTEKEGFSCEHNKALKKVINNIR